MTRRAFLLALPGAALLARNANAQDPIMLAPPTNLGVVPGGGAEGGDALYLNGGDLIGLRNLQGSSDNLDIGAGSTDNPASVIVNYDIGKDLVICDGRKNEVARIGRSGVWFAQTPRVGPARRRRRLRHIRCMWPW